MAINDDFTAAAAALRHAVPVRKGLGRYCLGSDSIRVSATDS
jgi:hypothetical protein